MTDRIPPVCLIGNSPAISKLRQEIDIVACSDARVLVTGESGAGKEVVARAIHAASLRRDRAFVPVNCAGIPEMLLESEMFGHVRGSFTGAYRDKPGKLETARGGTIFLDEIGEMTLRMQGVFLRFVETGELQKVGSERVAFAGDVRVIAATNRDLHNEIVEGRFREDLLYRLNVIHLVVPPLRERLEDVPVLIEHFLGRARPVGLYGAPKIADEALQALSTHSWPGNVRQLQNTLERVMVMTRGRDVIRLEDLPPELLGRQTRRVQPPVRQRTVAVTDELFGRIVSEGISFWDAVYPLYMRREITRDQVREVVHKGLQEARGNYKIVLQMFNMQPGDYKRFLDFLRNHDCKLSFKAYRTNQPLQVHVEDGRPVGRAS